MRKIKFLTICVSLVLSLSTIAQKHNLHFTAGGALTVSYEGQLVKSEEYGSRINFKLGVGERYHVGYTRDNNTFETKLYMGGSMVMLFGKKASLFELTFGLGNGWRTRGNISDGTYLLPLTNAGYRLESGIFLLRAGVGFPELLYLGLGIRF
jgi:hypothetical protein